jgi:hypothetical protein
VEQGDVVKLHTVTQGRDFGTSVEVLSGLSPNDVIIVNPPDSVTDGEKVRIARPQSKGQQKPQGQG